MRNAHITNETLAAQLDALNDLLQLDIRGERGMTLPEKRLLRDTLMRAAHRIEDLGR